MKITIALLGLALLFSGCGKSSTSNRNAANAEIKKGVAPVADSEIAIIEMETPAYGSIKIELYSNIAPKAVSRFKELAREGYYDGIEFHRINKSVIQAGNSDTKPGAAPTVQGGEGSSSKPNVGAEFSDVPYEIGSLGSARLGNDVNSANSQFFITIRREQAFDTKYTVFGKVIEGMNNVMTISGAPRPSGSDRPSEPVRIKTVRIEPKQ